MASFVPRRVYDHLSSIPRSYFIGHHARALREMKGLLASIDLVIECRDYRTPLASRNPLFEQNLGDRPRMIVYTKQDLGSNYKALDKQREDIVRKWDTPSNVVFCDGNSTVAVTPILDFAIAHMKQSDSLLGTRMMIVGMPNVGKSSLLNTLRKVRLKKGKVSKTGAAPGVTRRIAQGVKMLEDGGDRQLYLIDTPGVFIPYVSDAESMLKLALCGNVKDTIVPPTTIADYLLFHLNLQGPQLYSHYCNPTNDILVLLDAVARKQGRLKRGGEPDLESAAISVVQKWRAGNLGHFVLDDVSEGALKERELMLEAMGGSMNQARKAVKQAKREAYLQDR